MAEALEIRGVCKSYRGVRVLEPVSFRVESGRRLVVVGANGSGKSTLLRIIAQAERPDEGAVFYGGRDVRGERAFVRRTLGYIPQDDALAGDLTVREQLSLWLAACGLKGKPDEGLLRMLGLDALLRKRIRDLSGGMRKRVSIALALAQQPEVLIADEATEGLDGAYRRAVLEYTADFLKRGGVVVWCTHRADEWEPGEERLRLEAGKARPETD
ncbi:MAG: ABC transporter ATP-binding protein [Oscillospiraceae bacterium]|nr:ABC transporter ATP-binding protein [Oscillospiraceae bacterium]